ncbi:MAG: hypothetical protein Kow00114_33230 [Kiloniellaceae bacterium]
MPRKQPETFACQLVPGVWCRGRMRSGSNFRGGSCGDSAAGAGALNLPIGKPGTARTPTLSAVQAAHTPGTGTTKEQQ